MTHEIIEILKIKEIEQEKHVEINALEEINIELRKLKAEIMILTENWFWDPFGLTKNTRKTRKKNRSRKTRKLK